MQPRRIRKENENEKEPMQEFCPIFVLLMGLEGLEGVAAALKLLFPCGSPWPLTLPYEMT
jgi:hypothetical protein